MDPLQLWFKVRSAIRQGNITRAEASRFVAHESKGEFKNYANLETNVHGSLKSEFGEEYKELPRGQHFSDRAAIDKGDESRSFNQRFDQYLVDRGVPSDSVPNIARRGEQDRYGSLTHETDPFRPGIASGLGATFELGDNLLDVLGFEGTAAKIREEAEESRAERPVATIGAELASGFLTGKAAFTAGRALTKKGPGIAKTLLHGPASRQGPGRRAAQSLGRDALLGGTAGAVAGAGAADDPEASRGVSGALGAGLGAALGFVIPGAGRAAKSIGRRFRGNVESRVAARAVDILEPIGVRPSDDPPGLRAEKAQAEMGNVYTSLEGDWTDINPEILGGEQAKAARDIKEIFNRMSGDDEARRYVPAGLRQKAGSDPGFTASEPPYVHHVEEIKDRFSSDRFPEESRELNLLLENHVDELKHSGVDLDGDPRIDPDTPTGAALVDFLSQNPDPDVQRIVSQHSAGLAGKPAVEAARDPSFEDVQRTLANMRDDMSRGSAGTQTQYDRADLEDAMFRLDPRFRRVQRQWAENETMHTAALAGQDHWRSRNFPDRAKIEMWRMRDDPDARKAYVGSMFSSMVNELRYSPSGEAKNALDYIASAPGPLKELMEDLMEDSYKIDGVEALKDLRYAAQDERFLQSFFQRLEGVTLPLAAGIKPQRAFAYGMMTGRTQLRAR